MESFNIDELLNLPQDELREELEKIKRELERKRKYGLYWDDSRHKEDVVERCKTEMPILDEVDERRIHFIPEAKDLFDTPDRPQPTHLLIEGDNYHALSVLNYTHRGKIDLIYIDPPYNTGNKDFKYNDNFVDREDGDRHTKWLSFMEKRLELAKHLLKDTGVIFISIDDNEMAQLKLLCDRVFSERNLAGVWHWFRSATPPALSKRIKKNLEFVLCYQKTEDAPKFRGIKKPSISDDLMTKTQNTIKKLTFPANTLRITLEDQIVNSGIYGTDKYPNELLNDLIVNDGTNSNDVSFKNRFVWTQDKLNEELKKQTRMSLSKNLVLSYKKAEYSEEVPPSLIDNSVNVDTTENAGRELLNIFGNQKVFDYPKPVSLLKYIINFIKDEIKDTPSVILDFFAGSGTTGHAVLELNKDGGRRQFILCTNNENNICEEVTYERVKRVMTGYTNSKGEQVKGLGGKLRYMKTDFVKVSSNRDQMQIYLKRRCTDMLCLRENVFTPTHTTEGYEVFQDHDRVLAVLHDDTPQYKDALRDILNGISDATEKKLYVFSLERDVNRLNFEDFEGIEIDNVPAKIIDLYKREIQKV